MSHGVDVAATTISISRSIIVIIDHLITPLIVAALTGAESSGTFIYGNHDDKNVNIYLSLCFYANLFVYLCGNVLIAVL